MRKLKNSKVEKDEIDNEENSPLNKVNNVEEEIKDIIIPLDKKEFISVEKKSKIYWTEDTELAVVDYLNLDYHYLNNRLNQFLKSPKKKGDVESLREDVRLSQLPETIRFKQEIYRNRILKPLNRLVENIIFNFKLFRSDVDIKTLHNDCVSFVYSKFSNFDPTQNTKSFSFFGTIAKHYLLGEKKDLDKSHKVNLDYEDFREEADEMEVYEIDKISDLDSSFSFFKHVVDEIEKEINKENISENDAKVGDAIIQIFKSHENLGVYNKNQVYQLIKENTGLQTKDITYSLHRFRIFYKIMKQDFLKKQDK